jgi:CheY-like chemotaxis protein
LHQKPVVNLEEPDLHGLRVLLVEDDCDLRESLAILLEVCGASVTAVGSSRAALDALSQTVPDVLLSDLSMPEEDGFTLIRKIRALPANRGGRVPAAAVTAQASSEDRRRVLAAGFQAHVAKPVHVTELAAVVARLGGLIPPIRV